VLVHRTEYHVFLTPLADSQGLYVSSQGSSGFEVREQQGGTSNLAFSYRVVARRKGIEGRRLRGWLAAKRMNQQPLQR